MIKYGLLLVPAWYLLRLCAVRWGRARVLRDRLTPFTRRLHAWVLSAPATFAYVAIFCAFTLVQKTSPDRLIDLLTRLHSTNLMNLSKAPFAAMAESALWVADQGDGVILYVAVFVTVVAWAERRYGTPRIILICGTGHVLGSFLTTRIELWAIDSGRAPASLGLAVDVGVSYLMVAGCAAAVLLMRGPMLALVGTALALPALGGCSASASFQAGGTEPKTPPPPPPP
ncbi:MAG: rhomboid-like protein, partial [Streptosporangiaceae bacterium]